MLKEVVDNAVSKGLTFAICLLPGEQRVRYFIAGNGRTPEPCVTTHGEGSTTDSFVISPWLAPWHDRITIEQEVTPETFTESVATAPDTCKSSETGTPVQQITRDEYLAAVSRVIESCRQRQGKTVFSRAISSTMADGTTAGTIFDDLCREFPQTFRFIFHTPETGLWLGATPELLLDHDAATRRCRVMSLAGTRPRTESDTPWDDKNLRENRFVTDFITDTFRALGADATTGPQQTLRYGRNIEHICHMIEATLPQGITAAELIDRLNPTPALCGTPREAAIADITANELHDRGCYGGAVGLVTTGPLRLHLFVTLRCCHISGRTIRAFAGGGITPDSDPAIEWRESSAKASFFTRHMRVLQNLAPA